MSTSGSSSDWIPEKGQSSGVVSEENVIQKKYKSNGISIWMKENPGYSFLSAFLIAAAFNRTMFKIGRRKSARNPLKPQPKAPGIQFKEQKFWKSKQA